MKEYTKKTISVYDKLGSNYLTSIDHASPDEIYPFIDKSPSKGRILDVGCAGGRDSKIFADHGFHVTGIDLCEPFLQEAKKKVPEGQFLKKDVLELDFEEAYFDGIWACAVLLHLEKKDLSKVLSDFYRMLKQGGLIFIGVKQGEGERSIVDSLSDGNSRFFSFYQKDEIQTLVKAAGFNVTYSKIKDDDTGRGEVKWIRLIAEKVEKRSYKKALSLISSALFYSSFASLISWRASETSISAEQSTYTWAYNLPSFAKAGFPIRALEIPPSPMGSDVIPSNMLPGLFQNEIFWAVFGLAVAIILLKFSPEHLERWKRRYVLLGGVAILLHFVLFALWFD